MADWDKIGSSGDVEDRRGLNMAVGGLGGLGALVVLGLAMFGALTGNQTATDLSQALNQLQAGQIAQQDPSLQPKEFQGQDSYEVFTSKVLGSANDVWSNVFSSNGKNYQEPRLVLFRQATQSGCGNATSAVGPHYCPADQTIYIDETFFDELTTRLGASGGDVAEAYVIAHEVGHHVQNQLGILEPAAAEASVALELQADCFAGIWAHSLADKNVFEAGEINEAIDAAAAVGDDRVQQKTQGQVNPETWTHGSSEQRMRWFNIGYSTGSPARCDTFR